jgi:acyl-coenzyme A thioesterase PaaI-like protein
MPPHDAVAPAPHPSAPPPGTLLGSHYHRCFGCGADHKTGLGMAVRAGEGVSVQAEFTVTADHQGAPGLAHGGLLAAALDEALGSLAWLMRITAVTGRLETEFVRPVPVGSTLYLTARCGGLAGRKVYTSAEGHLDAPDGPVAIRAAAVFVQVGLEHFTTHGSADEMRAVLAEHRGGGPGRDVEVNP